MAGTRPYYIDFKGTAHMVEAASPAAAVKQIVGSDIREIRPARGAEVLAWSRAGKDIVIAGTKVVVAAGEASADVVAAVASIEEVGEPYKIGDVVVLVEKGSDYDPAALTAINAVRSEGRMTLENFDIIRTAYPEFNLPIAGIAIDTPITIADIDAVRSRLEEQPMDAQEVADLVLGRLQAMADAEVGPVGGADAMVGDTGHVDA